MRTVDEYLDSLKNMRPNIYKFGELIEDVTSNPSTRRCIMGHAQIFESAQKDEHRDLLTTTSSLTGEKISRYLSIVTNADEMVKNVSFLIKVILAVLLGILFLIILMIVQTYAY